MSDTLYTIILVVLAILLIVLIMRGRERNHYIYALPIAVLLAVFGDNGNLNQVPFYLIVLLIIFNYISAVIAFRVANAATESSGGYFVIFGIIVGAVQYVLLLLLKSVLVV